MARNDQGGQPGWHAEGNEQRGRPTFSLRADHEGIEKVEPAEGGAISVVRSKTPSSEKGGKEQHLLHVRRRGETVDVHGGSTENRPDRDHDPDGGRLASAGTARLRVVVSTRTASATRSERHPTVQMSKKSLDCVLRTRKAARIAARPVNWSTDSRPIVAVAGHGLSSARARSRDESARSAKSQADIRERAASAIRRAR